MTDLQAAAERVRKVKSGHFVPLVYQRGYLELNTDAYRHDLDVLAVAYLAEHPADDGKPITADVLWASGGWTFHEDPIEIAAYTIDRTERLVLCWRNTGVFHLGPYALPHIKTRAQLRRLLAALTPSEEK